MTQRFPQDMARAIQPITDLIAGELRAGQAAGLLHSTDPDRDAALINKMLMAVYHHQTFAAGDETIESVAAHLWAFCLKGIGGPIPVDAAETTARAWPSSSTAVRGRTPGARAGQLKRGPLTSSTRMSPESTSRAQPGHADR
ncbi:hypothetical protein [Frankia sp. EAN1pec]|uniref:hypothetical protein n=1 Tax=Parafrankia sp. (strain EAN1pec) TaxID=298653 RepID=UPI0002DE609A